MIEQGFRPFRCADQHARANQFTIDGPWPDQIATMGDQKGKLVNDNY
jgi:hypothetical protein